MGAITLVNDVDPNKFKQGFNSNSECLFNHCVIDNKILFFQIEEDVVRLCSYTMWKDRMLGPETIH